MDSNSTFRLHVSPIRKIVRKRRAAEYPASNEARERRATGYADSDNPRKRDANGIEPLECLPQAMNLGMGKSIHQESAEHPAVPNKAVEDDGDKRTFFGLRELSRALLSSPRASSLASL